MAKREQQRSAGQRPVDRGGRTAEEDTDIAGMPFEQAVAELESILERIEQGEIGLEESLRQFRRGDALVRRCRAILDVAELQVRELAVRDDHDEEDGDDEGQEGAPR